MSIVLGLVCLNIGVALGMMLSATLRTQRDSAAPDELRPRLRA
jgi:hypothetical protein